MTPASVRALFSALRSAHPEPKTELAFVNEFTLLVAIVLSAQATDASVNKATPALFDAADTPQKMVKLGVDGIKRHIKTIGLYNAKANNVFLLSQKLIAEFGGAIPRDRDALQTLPGVGRKTANVWLNCFLGLPTLAVDTHVFRVANRTGLVRAKTPLAVEEQLEKKIPAEFKLHAHHWLILHGRYVCIARKPKCAECIIYEWCEFEEKTA